MFRLLTIIAFLIPIFGFAPDGLKSIAVVEVNADKMVCDNIGNIYLIKGETISKYDSLAVLQKTFSNKTFGSITSADATNALRIVLFYKDFDRIVTLDNTLSQNGDAIALETIGFPLATLAAASHDNGFWIYDQQNFELVRLNRNLQIEGRTGNLSQLLGIELQPNFLMERGNRLFLNNPSTGILLFDIYGTYSKTIPIKDLTTFQVVDDDIVYRQNKQIINDWRIEYGVENSIMLTDSSDVVDLLQKDKFYSLQNNHMVIYRR